MFVCIYIYIFFFWGGGGFIVLTSLYVTFIEDLIASRSDSEVLIHQRLLDTHLGRGQLQRSAFKVYFRTITDVRALGLSHGF